MESQLRDMFIKRAEESGLTQAALADKLGIGRSAINRRLRGQSNMTLETVADMVWGVGGCIDVEIFDPADRPQVNHGLVQDIRLEWSGDGKITPLPPVAKAWIMESAS